MMTTILTHPDGCQTVMSWEGQEGLKKYVLQNLDKDIHIRPVDVAKDIPPEDRAYGYRLSCREVIDVRMTEQDTSRPHTVRVRLYQDGQWLDEQVIVPIYRDKKGLYIYWGGTKYWLRARRWLML
jgi:hypothetical protein